MTQNAKLLQMQNCSDHKIIQNAKLLERQIYSESKITLKTIKIRPWEYARTCAQPRSELADQSDVVDIVQHRKIMLWGNRTVITHIYQAHLR